MESKHFKFGINQWNGEPNKPVFYNQEMAKSIRNIVKPSSKLLMDIVKYPEFLAIRLYEDNFIQFDGIKKEKKKEGEEGKTKGNLFKREY